MANADVVIDKNVWTGDDLTVAADGTVTVSTGKEVSIKKSLLPGKYKLQGTVLENAKIVAVYGGHEYALNTEFEIAGENAADVTVKVTAVTADTQFSFSGVKFELIFDFAAAVNTVETQLSEIIKKGDNSNLRDDARWNNENGDLKFKSTELATKIKAIKNGDYKVYGENQLWKGDESPAMKALADEIAEFGKTLDAAVENVDAYVAAKAAYATAKASYDALAAAGGEWATASEYTKGLYTADYKKIGDDITAFSATYEKAYKDGNATGVDVSAFTAKVNAAIATLKTNIAKADGDNVSWTNIKAAYDAAQVKFNEATAAILDKMPANGNYADWNTEAITAIQAAWKKISDAVKDVEGDKAQAKAKEADVLALIAANQTVIENTQVNYIGKYTTCEANKAAADAAIATLKTNFDNAAANADVKKDFATAIAGIEADITALNNKVGKDYAKPHAIETADYTATVNNIQTKIDQLVSDAAPVIANYDYYNNFLAALGSDTGLQKKLNDAKAAVGELKPAATDDAYDAAAKFKVTADGLQLAIDNLAKEVKTAYDKRKLNATTAADYDSRIASAQSEIAQYQQDAEDAIARFDVVSAAVKDYNTKLNTLVGTVGANTSVAVRTASTTVAGATYGDRITALKTKKAAIENAFKTANDKLDAAHLAALLAISLDPTISTDADALNTAFNNDKKTSEDITKVEAAQIMYNAAYDVINSVETRIVNHETNDWKAGNADGQLGLKYQEIMDELAALKTDIQGQETKIRNVASDVSAITPDNAVEAMSLLAEIKADVDAINGKLTVLETKADTQIAFVKAENKAKKTVDSKIKSTEKILQQAIDAFQVDKIGTETIQPQVDAIQAKLDVVKTDAANERAAENLQTARKDSKDAEGATVKGIDNRIKDIALEANDLKQLAKDSTANYNSYKDLVVVYNGQKAKLDGANYTGYGNIFAKVRTLISAYTDGTNETYYLGLVADPNGKYVKEAADLKQAIEQAYTDGNVAERTDDITAKLKALTATVASLPDLAKDDKEAYDERTLAVDGKNSQVTEGDEVLAYWNEINNKFNASDIAPETLKPMLDELATIQKDIKDEQKLVDEYFAKGLSSKNDNEVMNKYSALRAQLKVKEDFINGNEDYNSVIAQDNLNRYTAFLGAVAKTDKANVDAKDLIKKYQNISTEELKALVNIDVIISAQEDIYKYSALIENLKSEAKNTYDNTVSPALWDVKATYAATAETYTAELNAAKQALDDAVNSQVRTVLDGKIAVLSTQLNDAKTAINTYDKNVQKNAFKDVADFYNKVNANGYRFNPLLINNLDSDWATFDEIDNMLSADLEKAAQAEWDAMYNGKYVGAAGTLTKDDDRYAGAKADNEKWLEALNGFAYDGVAADVTAYNNIVKNTLDKAVAAANSAIAANNMYAGLAQIKNHVDNFYAQARSAYDAAKAKADAFEANNVAFAQLTTDYQTLSDRIVAAAKYYQNYNIFDSAIEANINYAFMTVMNWQSALTKQNASAELANRIGGNTIEEGKSWYDYDAITGAIKSLYTQSNSTEITGLRTEIAAINTEKQDAIDKFYGKDTEKIAEIEKYYNDNCKNLMAELNDLLTSFVDNGTKDEAKQDAGLLNMEKKIAKAHAGLTKIWKFELVADATASLQQLIADAEEDFAAAEADFNDAHKPVQKAHAQQYEHIKNRFAEAKALLETSGDEILTYDDKIIGIVNKVVSNIRDERAALLLDEQPYDVHDMKYQVLKQSNQTAEAEVLRVEEAISKLNHLPMESIYDVDADGEADTWKTVYDVNYLSMLKDRIADNNRGLEAANKAAETGPASALLTNGSTLRYSVATIINTADWVERYAAFNETNEYYEPRVKAAAEALDIAANYGGYAANSSKGIYDPDGSLMAEYNVLDKAVNNLMLYAGQFDSFQYKNAETYFDINGNAWGYDDEGYAIMKYVDYVNDAEGAALVYATAEDLIQKATDLTSSLNENTYTKGDVNRDGEVLSDDYLMIIRGVLNPESLENIQFATADVNSDDNVNVSDVTLVANKVTTGKWPNNGPVSNRYAPMASSETMSVSAQENGGVQRVAINLNNHKNYVACQMDIVLPAGMTLVGEGVGDRANGHSLYSNDLGNVHRVLVSTLENSGFNGGNAIIYLDVEGGSVDNIVLQNVLFAEADGRATTIGGETDGINGVEAEGGLKQKIYSVGGQLLNKVKQGINIIRNANGSTKKVTGK